MGANWGLYNGDFSPEEVLDFACFDGIGTLVGDELV